MKNKTCFIPFPSLSRAKKTRYGCLLLVLHLVPEFIDPVFAKSSPKRAFSLIENERFGLVFAKTGSINLGSRVSKI
jgi:hypothetical protein